MFRISLLLAALAAAAAQPGVRAQFIGGTLPGVPPKSSARLDLSNGDTLRLALANADLRIPYQRIHTIEYGQNVSRRVAEAVLISPILLLSKQRKHFVTLGYTDGEGKEQALVVRVEKGDIRFVLSALEARTGRRVEFQDDEARKTGK
jgi:hypothetical protein